MNLTSSSTLSGTPVSVHVQRSLLKPLPERCRELTLVLRETSYKDLNTLFPQLVEHVYGFGHQSGWGLLSTSRNMKPQEFESVYHFLAPDGPLLLMAYKLLGDGHIRYEFPVTCLPVSSQCLLEEGDIPTLYTNKVPYCGPGRPVTHVLLNPFEYYMFHFAYSIVNPTHSKTSTSGNDNHADCLYVHLLETYLSCFLPLNESHVSSLPVFTGHQIPFRSPTGLSCTLPASLSVMSGTPQQLSYLYGSSLSPMGGLLKRPQSLTSISSPVGVTTAAVQEELWRAEFLVLALSEFWLGTSPNMDTIFMPSFLHIQLVRLMIKHLHFFRNSATKSDQVIDASSSGQLSPWDAFKCHVIPQLVQKKLYSFFRWAFDCWPLDASFRLPLEMWLSYVQPWRYVDPGLRDHREQQSRSVALQWQLFVTENLLFYSVLFKQLLPRFFRMELNSPKNSFLLFRVAKVFSQTNLQTMITEAEALLQRTCLNQLTSSSHFLSPTAVGQLRQFVVEMEGYNYCYIPMFGEQSRDVASQLLRLVVSAREKAALRILDLENLNPGFFQSALSWLFTSEDYQGGLTLSESQRVSLHLEFTAEKLCQLFQLSQPSLDVSSLQVSSVSSEHNLCKSFSFKDKVRPHSFHEVQYRGDPDLQPIRTFEVAFLVRMLHHLSTSFNSKYQNEINSVYMRTDWFGDVCRQFLMPPTTYFTEDKRVISIPPRLCLRPLAHKTTLMYLSLFYVLFCMMGGYSFFSYILVLMLLLTGYAVIRTFWKRRR